MVDNEEIRALREAVRRAEHAFTELTDRMRAGERGISFDDLVLAAGRLALARGDLRRAQRSIEKR